MGRVEWPPLLPPFFLACLPFPSPFPLPPRRSTTRKQPYLCFHLVCIPWGITRTGVARFSFRSFFAKSTPSLSLSLVSLDGESRGRAANSFKSRCGPGNSANPLRIHRAPLANSSLLLTSSFPRSLLPPSRCGFPPPPPLPRLLVP